MSKPLSYTTHQFWRKTLVSLRSHFTHLNAFEGWGGHTMDLRMWRRHFPSLLISPLGFKIKGHLFPNLPTHAVVMLLDRSFLSQVLYQNHKLGLLCLWLRGSGYFSTVSVLGKNVQSKYSLQYLSFSSYWRDKDCKLHTCQWRSSSHADSRQIDKIQEENVSVKNKTFPP